MFWDHGLTSAATGQTVIFDTSAILQDTPLLRDRVESSEPEHAVRDCDPTRVGTHFWSRAGGSDRPAYLGSRGDRALRRALTTRAVEGDVSTAACVAEPDVRMILRW